MLVILMERGFGDARQIRGEATRSLRSSGALRFLPFAHTAQEQHPIYEFISLISHFEDTQFLRATFKV
jgi:hypothetical protein